MDIFPLLYDNVISNKPCLVDVLSEVGSNMSSASPSALPADLYRSPREDMSPITNSRTPLPYTPHWR
jgi:hypothetical protein